MDESALRTLLNSLDVSRSSLHGLLHFFTGLVVVGLGFDLFVVIKEFRDDWEGFRYGQTHPYDNHLPGRPNASLLILALLGTALIVIGVAGELYVDVKAGKIETQIRQANDRLLGLVIQEAGDAATSARTARQEADAVKVIADEARADAKDALSGAGQARKEADSFEADIRSAKETATKTEEHLADATQRTLRLEQQLSWRTVTPEQTQKLKNSLSPALFANPLAFKGLKIGFSYLTGDAEGGEYAEELSVALRNAFNGLGPEVSKPEIGEPTSIAVFGTGPPPKGVWLQVKDAKSPVAAIAVFLQKVLKDAGIDAPGELREPPGVDINLFVGGMPHPK